jgi:hypothetical protein
MNPFDVLVLRAERILCEKIMSLVRFSQTEQPITDLSNKIKYNSDSMELYYVSSRRENKEYIKRP